MTKTRLVISDDQLVAERNQARVNSKWHLLAVFLFGLTAYATLELVGNLDSVVHGLPEAFDTLGTSKFVGGGRPLVEHWRSTAGIGDSDAMAIVLAMLGTVVTINVAAIAATLSTRDTGSAEHALNRWFARMAIVARIAPSVAIAVAGSRLPGNVGLGAVLLVVGIIAGVASNLDLVGQLRNIRAKVRLADAREADISTSRAVASFEGMIGPKARAGILPDPSARWVLRPWALAVAAGVVVAANVAMSVLVGTFTGWIRGSDLADLPTLLGLVSAVDFLILGSALGVILGGAHWVLIWEARTISRSKTGRTRPRGVLMVGLYLGFVACLLAAALPVIESSSIWWMFTTPIAFTAAVTCAFLIAGWVAGRGPGVFSARGAHDVLTAARKRAANELLEAQVMAVEAIEEGKPRGWFPGFGNLRQSQNS